MCSICVSSSCSCSCNCCCSGSYYCSPARRTDTDRTHGHGHRHSMGRVGFDSRIFFRWMAGHPCLTLRARSLCLQGDPANIGKGRSRPARCTREAVDRFGIPNPRKTESVIGADRQRFGPSCVLLKRVPQGRTESGSIVLAAICWATSAQRRCPPEEALYLPTFSHLFDCQ